MQKLFIYNNYLDTRLDYNDLLELQYTKPVVNSGGGTRGNKKWKTLIHNGVLFYPEYQSHNIPIKYDSEPIYLNPDAEEFITYYVNKRFDKYRNDRFNRNFFNDWKKLLSHELKKRITEFSRCNFDDIKRYVELTSEQKSEIRKTISKEDRESKKKKNELSKDKYTFAMVDGSKQAIDNFLVEPPTIFVGRGLHPLSGCIKKRLRPEDITINVSTEMKIPVPCVINTDGDVVELPNTQWGEIISDDTLEWIASWQNNVTQKYNYARFGRKSSFKMKSDEDKYDKARLLKKKIKRIREKNEKNMSSDNKETRQLATCLFLIDRLALRVGNEKKSTEADTIGVTTLKNKNVILLENNILKIDFLVKDSIRYLNKVKIPDIVYNNIKEFHDDPEKKPSDELFELVNSDTLNKYIKQFMRILTCKIFRTFNASYTMQGELNKIFLKYKDYDKPDMLQRIHYEYEIANLKVAKLCNHQKESTKTSGVQLEKVQSKITDIQSKINKLKRIKLKRVTEGKSVKTVNAKISKLQGKLKIEKSKKSLKTQSVSLSSGTSKQNYIDPRITIAFLKKMEIFDNVQLFFNSSMLKQFEWAMDVDENFRF